MSNLTSRQLVPELMDQPDADPAELRRALRFLELVNARLGGASATIGHLDRWSRSWSAGEPIRLLDIGTGVADIPLAICRWAARRGFKVEIVGVDLHETTLALAREHLAAESTPWPIELVRADALKLHELFQPGSFDYAHAGMFLHHLTDVEVLTVLRIMHRLARRGLIWNDLLRGLFGRVTVNLIMKLVPGLPRMVRHDAIVSVNAGFTKREAIEMAARVGLPNVRYRRHLGYRFTLASSWSDIV